MNLHIKDFLLCMVLFLLFSACQQDDSLLKASAKESIELNDAFPKVDCEYQLFGFADFPFQAIVINNQDYPICDPQLCIKIEDIQSEPFFSISSQQLKFCESSFTDMVHHQDCSDFEPNQISYLQFDGGTEIQFFFQQEFWNCFLNPSNYPEMDFQVEHAFPFI